MSYFFNGQLVDSPAVMSRVDDTAMLSQGVSVGNNLALVGKADGGQPQTALVFGSPAEARATLAAGELLDAVIRAFNPSNETGGPATVTAIRVDPATQATLQLRDSGAAVVITLTSQGYGLRENQIKVKVEAATGGRGLKLTTQRGNDFYTGDNIFRNAFSIQYGGAQASAVMTTNGQTLTLQAPSGTTVATIDLATYPTVQQLVDRINAVSGFTAAVLDGNGASPSLQGLDFVTAQDVKTASYTVRADLQATVDWFNSSADGFVSATRTADVGTLPAAMAFTYLSGAVTGSAQSSDWSNAFTVLQTVDVQWVSPVTSDPIFAVAASGLSSLTIPAASRTTSPSGQNVIPSPYGRQRPRATRATSEAREANSRMSRDLPTPASPTSVTSRALPVLVAVSSSVERRDISASRPTNGVPCVSAGRAAVSPPTLTSR